MKKLPRMRKILPPVKISRSEEKAIKQSRKEIKNGEYITLDQLKYELGC